MRKFLRKFDPDFYLASKQRSSVVRSASPITIQLFLIESTFPVLLPFRYFVKMSGVLRSLWSRSFQVSHAESAAVQRQWILTGIVASTGLGEYIARGSLRPLKASDTGSSLNELSFQAFGS